MSNDKLTKSIRELNRLTGLSLQIPDDASLSAEESSRAIEQIQSLIEAYAEKNDQTTTLKRLITGNIDTHEIPHVAKRFHFDIKAPRALFLIESKQDMDETVLSILRNSFPDRGNTWFIPIHNKQIAMVSTYSKKPAPEQLQEQAYLVMDILNAEAMIRANVAYSAVVEQIEHLSDRFKDAVLALKVGLIFYPEQHIYAYNALGLGRLIYGLTKDQCIPYMLEAIGPGYEEILLPETAHTFNCFFENNLNIAETARKLHMHRNTLIYRLEQIQKQTGLDVRQIRDAMTFKTALLIMNYLTTLS
ncbi:MAG: helix-turn-helix domain-containing protein [Lachnospiraceae bacterium]|nr:helix-turn-helix domain-containing protein [Candidatus Equihabitans merdae]